MHSEFNLFDNHCSRIIELSHKCEDMLAGQACGASYRMINASFEFLIILIVVTRFDFMHLDY